MAPGLVENIAAATQSSSVDRNVFPDGFKTSGQFEPVYSKLQAYENFPTTITGPTVWQAAEFGSNPEKWTHSFTDDEIAELGAVSDAFIDAKLPLTGMTKVCIPPRKSSVLMRSGPIQAAKIGC